MRTMSRLQLPKPRRKEKTMNMDWLEKLRPQVLAVIVVLGVGAVYLINQGSTGEGATVLGVTAGIATKLIESKD